MFEFPNNQNLCNFVQTNLRCEGCLYQTVDGYLFLKIHDDFIHALFPFVEDEEKLLPEYFSPPKKIGAHISVIYPTETTIPMKHDFLEQVCTFRLSQYFKAKIQDKFYFGCTVKSVQLEQIRAHFGLGSQLNFKGILVPFHFTIAVKPLIA